MKKIVLLSLFALLTSDLFSQIHTGNIVFSVDGNYVKTTTENGVTTNYNVSQIRNLSFGISAGYFLTDRFMAGIGLDYERHREARTTELMINRFLQGEIMNIKSNALLPNICFGYYQPIIDKFYINISLKLGYGKVKSEYNSVIVGKAYVVPDSLLLPHPGPDPYQMGKKENSEAGYFRARLLPELTYFIGSNVGLNLDLGGIEYSTTDLEKENSNWRVNFNPIYWRLGLKIRI